MAILSERPERNFSVLRIILDTGERLPCLVDSETRIPVRVATRWAVRFRRLRTQSSTLADNLRIIGRLYTWASSVGGFDLDDYLTGGQLLNVRQIESLAVYLQASEASSPRSSKDLVCVDNHTTSFIDPGTYDHQLAVIEDFLKWALYSDHRGGVGNLSLDQLFVERCWLEELFASLHIGARPSQPLEPLEDNEILAIRTAIGPIHKAGGRWDFPEGIFSKFTQLRNWLMFETALQLGLRRGELLKLRLDSIPRGGDDAIVIKRNADDLRDPRTREPAVKTAERAIPASRDLLLTFRAYLTMPPPTGRIRGRSPYLFTNKWGDPLSLDMTDDIIQAIGKYSRVSPLSWHRLRHTWAEKLADKLYEEPNGMEQLAYLGGWTNLNSSDRYIQRTKRRHGEEFLRNRQKTLYS